jgi:anaerobic magnesium-protoporphyrin IX monomethyl ester cyclase
VKILLVVYDNDAYVSWFPQGTAYIAAALRQGGHEVRIYNQDVNHYPEEHLTALLDGERFDAVGVSFIAGYYQYRKILKISEAINRSRQRPSFMLGGHGPAPEPDYFLRKTGADLVVVGEGEETVIELMAALSARTPLAQVKGIAYRENGKTITTERRPLIKDIDSIPLPAYDLFPMHLYRLLRMPHSAGSDFVIPVLSGRGCPFTCNFCYRLDEGFRPRKNEAIIEEIQMLKARLRPDLRRFLRRTADVVRGAGNLPVRGFHQEGPERQMGVQRAA